MTITPESVRNKEFSTIRLREGYDMGEVDAFLDQVEHELERLITENESLRARVQELEQAGGAPAAERPAVSEPEPAQAAETTEAEAAQPEPAAAPAEPQPPVRTVGEASTAAVRILEKAAVSADELVAEAKASAEKLVADATSEAQRLTSEAQSNAEELETRTRAEAERLTNEAHDRATRLEADARSRAEALDDEVKNRRIDLFSKLETERDKLARDVDELRSFERSYRGELQRYFTEQLQALSSRSSLAPDANGVHGVPAAGSTEGESGDEESQLQALHGDGGDHS